MTDINSVGDMADYVHVSNGRLQTIYKDAFGISCVSDIIAARIRYARYKLVCSDMPLAGISLECGYKNIEHFSDSSKSRQVIHQRSTGGRHRINNKKILIGKAEFLYGKESVDRNERWY